MHSPKFPTAAAVGAAASPVLYIVGFLFFFVSGIRWHIAEALVIGTALILLATVLLISGIILIGVHRMLVSALTPPEQPQR